MAPIDINMLIDSQQAFLLNVMRQKDELVANAMHQQRAERADQARERAEQSQQAAQERAEQGQQAAKKRMQQQQQTLQHFSDILKEQIQSKDEQQEKLFNTHNQHVSQMLTQTHAITETTQHMAADMLTHSHSITNQLLTQIQQQQQALQSQHTAANSPSVLNRRLSASDLLELDPLFAGNEPVLSTCDELPDSDQLTHIPEKITLAPTPSADSPKFPSGLLFSNDTQSPAHLDPQT